MSTTRDRKPWWRKLNPKKWYKQEVENWRLFGWKSQLGDYFLSTLVVILVGLVVVGIPYCTYTDIKEHLAETPEQRLDERYYITEYRGHTYIVRDKQMMTHDPDCECKERRDGE